MGGMNNRRSIATQAAAEAGLSNTVDMSPLRTAQAIAALGSQRAIASQEEAEAGTANTVDMTPLRTAQAIAALAGGGSWIYLSTVTAIDSATVDIETTFDATYDVYALTCTDLVPANTTVNIIARMKIAGAYATAAYKGHVNFSVSGAATYAGLASRTDGIDVLVNQGNAADECAQFTLYVHNPTKTARFHLIHWEGAGYRVGEGGVITARGVGANTGLGALTGLRFYASAGNIASGTFRLYGIKNS